MESTDNILKESTDILGYIPNTNIPIKYDPHKILNFHDYLAYLLL